jgi:hypothetical protein
MIEIVRNGQLVCVKILGGPLNSTYRFDYDCGSEHYAELLTLHFNANLSNLIVKIREEEYTRGFKEGRQKKEKKSWFSCLLKLGHA